MSCSAAAAADPGYGSALPRFALFGWVSPPCESTTVARYAELAGAGFNVVLPEWDDAGTAADNALRLDASRPFGLGNLILDNDLDSVWTSKPASLALADTIVWRYRDDPAFLGYYLGDEPMAQDFPRLGEWFDILRARDPAHPAWNSLRPRGGFASLDSFRTYVEQYVDATHPAVLCNNQYDFRIDGDGLRLTENVSTLGAIARAHDIPFWGIVLLVQHASFRHVTEGMLRWQIAQWIAWGATGIGYFTYWTPAPDPYENWQPAMIEWGTGERTAYYDMVTAIDSRLAPIGATLAGCRWLATEHAGSVPPGGVPFAPDTLLRAVDGRATLGLFSDSTGAPCVFVANADSLASQTVTVTPAEGRRAWRLSDDGSAWDPLPAGGGGGVALALGPGDFVLLRLSRPAGPLGVGPPGAGAGPSLTVAPNPTRGGVRFVVAWAAGPARIEVLDLGGRDVWSRALAPGAREASWNGVRADGGPLPAGLYFARLSAPDGVVVRRLAWLGRP